MMKMLRVSCGMYRIPIEMDGNQHRDSMRVRADDEFLCGKEPASTACIADRGYNWILKWICV